VKGRIGLNARQQQPLVRRRLSPPRATAPSTQIPDADVVVVGAGKDVA
jgi:hypothetical protein